ncbi:NUDIX hydrolase [Citrobacter rodentium]|nr:NUDIX hydrolase [Citrobacter rodentium]QBY29589.1 hypothetical protein E2R62_12430 [Citrobacter rodentium]HAT8014205.1 hypothetical protein [Citrobacter rodentium NBRC 105723 = DSM 16636]HAT8019145.1 hypothetical protein [Citrobacter rodentium]HAT8028799.1 hypothetical protein [Citrobacter rodentium]HAT8031583.1 hypothetical protein [Citrobacter rodentium]
MRGTSSSHSGKTLPKAPARKRKVYVIVYALDADKKLCILVGRHAVHGFGTFPGGTQDPKDKRNDVATIKREFQEEIGFNLSSCPDDLFKPQSRPEEVVQIYKLGVTYERLMSICVQFSPQKSDHRDPGIDLIAIMEASVSLREVFSSTNSDYFHSVLSTLPGATPVVSKYTDKAQVADAWKQVRFSKAAPKSD